MKAKSISGKSTADIKVALNAFMAEGYKPTLAIVFLTNVEEIEAVSAEMDTAGMTIFGTSTFQKFNEQEIDPEGIMILLLDINPDYFKVVLKDFQSSSVYDAACQSGEVGATAFKNPAFIITTADYNIPGEQIINGLLDKAGTDVTVIGGMGGR
jgi:hypothetical protein